MVEDNREALPKAQTQLASVISSLPVILWTISSDGTIELSEGRGLQGLALAPGQLVGASVYDVYAEFPETLEYIRRGLSGEQFQLETIVAGNVWSNRYFPHKDELGQVIGLTGLSLDITESKRREEKNQRLEEQLQHKQKLESLGVLAGGIAHDFNNLLVGIMGNVSMALGEVEPASAIAGQLTKIRDAAVRAADLTNQMLAYSGSGQFVIERVDLNQLVQEMSSLLGAAACKSAKLELHLSETPPIVQGDPTQLRQVVMHLITNASDAIGSNDGTISITTGTLEAEATALADTYLDDDLAAGSYAYLRISDTGEGMSSKIQKRIFDPFFTTKFSGRGLGLAAVLGIIRGHRGALDIQSEVGTGTVFKILLPSSSSDGAMGVSERHDTGKRHRAAGRILVVDDEPLVRETIGALLTDEGFDVSLAENGIVAVTLFEAHQDEIAAVVLDMTMPHMGGVETFRRLRDLDRNVRVILMSGYSQQDVISRFTEEGLAGFLQKPFHPDVMLELLGALLADS